MSSAKRRRCTIFSRGRIGRRRDQARHGGRDGGRAGVDRPRQQGTRGADRLSARLLRRSRRTARTEADAAFVAAAGRSAGLGLGRKSAEDADAVAAARAQAREAQAGEHRRLLYVAMTRAAQRLIVAGYETSKRRPPDCWYDLVHSGLADELVERRRRSAGAGRSCFRRGSSG